LLSVGPASAGAEPGPACYDRGGELPTVTDADLALGFLDADNFLGGAMQLRPDLAQRALARLAAQLGLDATETAWGVHNLVNENMAGAARVHVAEKGLDPRRFTLVATGGAGPVHAVEVAQKLGIKRVLCTVAAGAGSCLGLLAAPARVDRTWSRVQLLRDVRVAQLRKQFERMYKDAARALDDAGANRMHWTLGAQVRYVGQGNAVDLQLPFKAVDAATAGAVQRAFERRYRQLFGALVPGGRPQVVAWRLTGESHTRKSSFRLPAAAKVSGKAPLTRKVYLPQRGAMGDVPVYERYSLAAGTVYERYSLAAGTKLAAPAILQERESTIVVARAGQIEILENLTVSVSLQ